MWRDAATERVLDIACQVARADVPVLITGPNGAGKERIAEIIQANSAVRDGPFVTLNCGAMPAELIEAELFGAEAGAFTGAAQTREGKFEAADGGTLFLDEIGNLPLAGQMKLLRVLETGRFQRLGSNRERQVKVRVISATNADLPADDRRRNVPPGPATTGSTSSSSRCRRWPNVPTTSSSLAEHFLPPGKALDASAQSALLAARVAGQRARAQERDAARRHPRVGRRAVRDRSRPAAVRPRSRPTTRPRRSIATAIERPSRARRASSHRPRRTLGLSRQALYRRMERFGIPRNPADTA